MATKPFSVRFSENLTKLIQSLSNSEKKTPSDFIREAVEEKAYGRDGFRGQLVPLLKTPKETMSSIREKLEKRSKGESSEPLSRVEISAMMIFCHQAYVSNRGYANPSYIMTLLDITKELLQEAQTKRLEFDFHYSHSKLGFDSIDQGYEVAFVELKNRFMGVRSISWSETLTRPLSDVGIYLGQFSDAAIARIFSVFRLEGLLPLAVKGVGPELSDHLISRDMKQLLPVNEKFQVGGVIFMVYAEPFAMVVEEAHHCYAFQAESLMSLFLFSESDFPVNQGPFGAGMKRNNFEVNLIQGKAIIHESGGYRLHLAESEFMELRTNLRKIRDKQQWDWLLRRFRSLKGDL